MFSILLGMFDPPTQEKLTELCQQCGIIHIVSAATTAEWFTYYEQKSFDCFLFQFGEDLDKTRSIVHMLRESQRHKHTPILLFSTQLEYLISVQIHWHGCEFFLLPLDRKHAQEFTSLLHYYDGLYHKIHLSMCEFCQIHTTKEIYNFPNHNVLFFESKMKKSIVHLKDGSIPVPYPLYQIYRMLNQKVFVQTHRSYIVNINNVSYVDKSKEPWGIFFFESEKEALISRSHKALLPSFFQPGDIFRE